MASGSVFKLVASGGSNLAPQPIDEGEVRRALTLLADPEAGCQFFFHPSKNKTHHRGDDLDGMIASVKAHAGENHIYVVLNPLPIDFDGYRNNEAILRRVWLFIDIDPIKPARHQKNPATDEEHEQTRIAMERVRDHLALLGWPAPIQVDSGNGCYLLYRVELENNEANAGLIRSFLETMTGVIGETGKIDTGVGDAARIARLPGTWNRKGMEIGDRRWRQCRFMSVPTTLEVVTRKMIENAVGPKPEANGKHKAEDKKTSKKSSLLLTAGSDGANRFVQKAMDYEAEALANAPQGERNRRLNKACYSLAGYVSTGYLSRDEIETRMFAAACECGLDKDDGGEKAVRRTIRSGIEAGMGKPRMVLENESYQTRGAETEAEVPAAWELCFDDQVIAEGDAESILEPVDGLAEDKTRTVFQIYTGPTLMRTKFPSPSWVIPGLLSEGLNILAGKPKMGKSILALNLGLTISGGGLALGNTAVEQGDVLYLALEDKFRRVQLRAGKMTATAGMQVSKHFALATEWPRCDAGGLQLLDKWLKKVAQPRLVIIDVWPMFKPASKPGSRKSAYDEDYAAFGELKKFCDRRGINCLVLLHCRKGLSEDVLDEVSGTLGQVGASDGILVLSRSRTNSDARVFVCGRDVDEQELSLAFDLPTLTWKSLGPSAEHMRGALQRKIIEFLKNHQPSTTSEIARGIDSTRQSVQKVLDRFLDKDGQAPARKVGDKWTLVDEGEI